MSSKQSKTNPVNDSQCSQILSVFPIPLWVYSDFFPEVLELLSGLKLDLSLRTGPLILKKGQVLLLFF